MLVPGLLLSLCVGGIVGTVLLTSTPEAITPGLDIRLTLNCTLAPDSNEVNTVTVIKIEKVVGNTSSPLVSISVGDHARQDTDFLGKEATVDGVISSNSTGESFLQLTISPPDETDVGKYVCLSTSHNTGVHLQRSESSTSVSVTDKSNPTMPLADLLLLEEVQRLRNVVAQLGSGLNCAEMTNCSSSSLPSDPLAFCARPAHKRPFQLARLVFEEVDMNTGSGYNPGESTFTAPVNGSYVFQASISGTKGKTISELKVNGESRAEVVTQGDDQSSVSLVLDLQAGDTVWLSGAYHSLNDTSIFADKDTLFCGYLLNEF